jgi:hypothetical protein
MSDEAAEHKDPVEAMVDGLLDDLDDFFPGKMRDEAREFLLDAAAAHPVTRVLAERVRPRAAPDWSGEEPSPGMEPQVGPGKKSEESK